MFNNRLRYLLKRYYDKSATSDERAELMAVLADDSYDEEVRALLLELITGRGEKDTKLEDDRAGRILKRIFEQGAEVSPLPESTQERGTEKRSNWNQLFYWAAAAAIVFGVGIYALFSGKATFPLWGSIELADNTDSIEILPGTDKALLTLWDGTVINLENGGGLQGRENIKIDPEKGELTYSGMEKQVGYNVLTTPLGGQYKVRLPDGSVAWLNAGSSLRFPTSFIGNKRIVEVTGEVFFEVSHQKHKPFIVRLDHPHLSKPMEVVVLGTQFNVSSYSDDPAIQTTLVTGSVEVRKGSEVKVLVPGEQAEISKPENLASRIEVKTVDAESVTAWKNGMFEFSGDSLDGIMRQISRWYNVEVEYEGDVSSKQFYGAISRKEQASEVLKILEMTGGVKFEVNGNKIKVKAV